MTARSPLPTLEVPRRKVCGSVGVGISTSMDSPQLQAVSDSPLRYELRCSGHRLLTDSDFAGRVGVAIVFVSTQSSVPIEETACLRAFDEALHQFGARRVQLVLVVQKEADTMATELGVNVMLANAPTLARSLGLEADEQERIASLVLDNMGMIVESLRTECNDLTPLPLLKKLDSLIDQFPERFAVLPDPSFTRNSGPDHANG